MGWLLYVIAGLTALSLVNDLAQLLLYKQDKAPRLSLLFTNVTVLMLCASLLTKGTP